jgi:transketolase
VDAYSIKPLATDIIREAAGRTRQAVLTVEDHYAEGGLGEAVAAELATDGFIVHRLAVTQIPHSGKAEELLARYGIDASAIRDKVHEMAHQLETHPRPELAGAIS